MTDAEDDEDELSRIEVEIERLQREIEQSTQRGHGQLRSHCELQHELELVWHRQAELEENIRIKNVRRHAVESGFVVTPIGQFVLGECPLCLEEMSDPTVFHSFELCKRYTCCGAAYCNACADLYWDKSAAACVAFQEALRSGNEIEVDARQRELEILHRCPFCRAINPPGHEENNYRMAMVHAEAGTAWAQTYIGLKLFSGDGVPKDLEAAKRWFTMAAEQGDIDSMSILAILLRCNGPAEALKSNDKAWELAWPAARQGSAPAQATCAEISADRGSMTESLQWYTLSAAQGFLAAQHELGRLHYEEEDAFGTLSPFKAHYWLRKAALRHCHAAQWYMSNLVVKIAKIVHGSDKTTGYCPWPESFVWSRAYADFMANAGESVTQAQRDRGNMHTFCIGCFLFESPTVTITRCAECQTFGYCSETCREIHWKSGHEADCNRAKELKQSLARKEQ
jgi:TPR repeat protein